MTTLAVRATAVKNSDDMKRTSDIRFMLLELPNTKIFNIEPDEPGKQLNQSRLFNFKIEIHFH